MRCLPAVCMVAILACAPASAEPARITYIANEGFLVEVGAKKILIDAIFNDETIDYAHVPDATTRKSMERAKGPFRGVDLVLVTHRHRDHFAAGSVLRHLQANPDAVLIAPPQAVEQLLAEEHALESLTGRVREVDLDAHESVEMSVHGIHVEAHRLLHAPYMVKDDTTGETYNRHEGVENLAYQVEVGGVSLFHAGDAVLAQNLDSFTESRFPRRKVNFVFLEFFDGSEETKTLLQERMSPDHVVFMHLPPQKEQIEKLTRHLSDRFPNAVLFQEPLETRSF